MWQKWCERIDKMAQRSQHLAQPKGFSIEQSEKQEHTNQEKELLLDPILQEHTKALTETKKPKELSPAQRKLQGKKKELRSNELRMTLKSWRKMIRLQKLEKMYKVLNNEKLEIDVQRIENNNIPWNEQRYQTCNTLYQKVRKHINDILRSHPPSLQECCSWLNKDTPLGKLAVGIRAFEMSPYINEALKKLDEALLQPNLDTSQLQTFRQHLKDFQPFAHLNTSSLGLDESYWPLKEQAEGHLLKETPATATQRKIFDIWTELLSYTHPTEQTLNKQKWYSQGNGEDITNDLQVNRSRNTSRTEFLITPRIEIFSRNTESESLHIKEIGNILRSRIETELRKSLIAPIDTQLQENASTIESLNQQSKDLENRKDANIHLKAAEYFARTGEQPYGYGYTIVSRFYALEDKSPKVLTRETQGESQTYIFSEVASITDKFNVNDGALRRVITGERNEASEKEGDGVWKRSLGEGTQELPPDIETIKLLEDYRLQHASNMIVLHEEHKILYITNQPGMLGQEFGEINQFLSNFLAPNHTHKLPEYLKFIHPHKYPENEEK